MVEKNMFIFNIKSTISITFKTESALRHTDKTLMRWHPSTTWDTEKDTIQSPELARILASSTKVKKDGCGKGCT
jgi:hypothetical protein